MSEYFEKSKFIFSNFYHISYNLDYLRFFSQIVVMYDTRLTRFPYLIAMVESTEDVQRSVLFARGHNMKLSVRGTGHDYIGRSTADMSLQINLSRMRGRKVNLNSTRSDAGEITAEAGNTWVDMYREVIISV